MQNYSLILPEDIYSQHLQNISNIKFTPREIDIIACILSGKNPQAISTFLSLESKSIELQTVSTHISNIRRKIDGTARGSIIEFIEKSDKHQIVRNYYLSLLMQKEFYKILGVLTSLLQPHIESFTIFTYPKANCELGNLDLSNESSFINKLQTHLKFLTSHVYIANQHFNSSASLQPSTIDKQYIIHILPALPIENIEDSTFKYLTSGQNQQPLNLLLLSDNSQANFLQSLSLPCVNVKSEQNYYFLFFDILKPLFPSFEPYLEEISNKFKKRYEDIYGIQSSLPKYKNIEKVKIDFEKATILENKNIQALILLVIMIGVISGLILFYHNGKGKNNHKILSRVNSELNNLILDNKDSSTNNAQIQRNNHIKRIEQLILEQVSKKELYTYFSEIKLSSDELLKFLYNLCNLANHYNYNNHDGEKVRNILKHAKNLVENYIYYKSKRSVSLDTLSEEEIISELNIVKGLPEIYCKIIYMLGRSYIYQKNKEEAVKYFKLSKYLGNKFGLFEAYLSVRSGLGIIESVQIDNYIRTGNFTQAKEMLEESIKLYEQLKSDNKKYKLENNPLDSNIKIIVPKEDIYNRMECGERIVKNYIRLLSITNNSEDKKEYLNKILEQFIGNEIFSGLLTELKNISPKKSASIYNTLGNTLLKLYEEKVGFEEFKEYILLELNIREIQDLELIKYIFNLAKSLSRNTGFTKVDAYNGLMKTYQTELRELKLPSEEREVLSKTISALKEKRDNINKNLKREDP